MNYLIGDTVRLFKFTDRYITPHYISWLNNPKINRYMYTGRLPVSDQDMNDPNDHNNFLFAVMSNLIVEPKPVKVGTGYDYYIGTISLNSIDWINRNGEIGYMIGDSRYWGLGIATEAVGLVSDWAINRLNLHKIESGVVAGHTPSIRVLEKNGFVHYGTIPEDYFLEGKYHSTKRFFKLQELK